MGKVSNTKVISSRVPADVYMRLQSVLKEKNMSMSEYISADLLNVKIKRVNVSEDIPEELKVMLGASGGLLAGSIVYHAINKNMPKDRFTNEEIEAYSWIGAVSIGLLAGMGLLALMSSGKK